MHSLRCSYKAATFNNHPTFDPIHVRLKNNTVPRPEKNLFCVSKLLVSNHLGLF